MVSMSLVTHFRLSQDMRGEDQQRRMMNSQIKIPYTHTANTPTDNLSSYYSCAKTYALPVLFKYTKSLQAWKVNFHFLYF